MGPLGERHRRGRRRAAALTRDGRRTEGVRTLVVKCRLLRRSAELVGGARALTPRGGDGRNLTIIIIIRIFF